MEKNIFQKSSETNGKTRQDCSYQGEALNVPTAF